MHAGPFVQASYTVKVQNWKSKLVSTGLPLEYQVARLLTEREFWVGADYGYLRRDGGVEKEFTIDIHAMATIDSREDMFPATFDLLVECKQRRSDVVWLFVPDPNGFIGMSHEAVTLRAIDVFSPWKIKDTTFAADPPMDCCYKGIEIDTVKGAYDSELRHGILQLQYAIPALLRRELERRADEERDWNTPIFFVPLLVTNARLMIGTDDMNVARVEGTDQIDELGRFVPYLEVVSACGPTMTQHLKWTFANAPDFVSRGSIADAEHRKRAAGVHETQLPSLVAKDMARGSDLLNGDAIYDSIVVCNVDSFDSLVAHLRGVVTRVVETLAPQPRWT